MWSVVWSPSPHGHGMIYDMIYDVIYDVMWCNVMWYDIWYDIIVTYLKDLTVKVFVETDRHNIVQWLI